MGKAVVKQDARRERFCQRYVVHMNAKLAAEEAGYSTRAAKQVGHSLLQKESVQARIQELLVEKGKRNAIDADMVLQEFWAIAKADPRELIEYRVGACRYCHGEGHRYQRTPREREMAFAEWESRKVDGRPPFDEQGGVGYDRNRAPHSGCPECNGLGEGFTLVKDQRNISRAAARLLAGVKETKEGIEVKMHNPQDALVSVGKHVGMFIERVDHTTDGQPLPPTQIAVVLVKPRP